MYGWLWRRPPFNLAGKITTMVVLAAAVVAILWLWVFPAADHLMPFGDVRVGP
jgi:hypothetical protein